VRGRLEADEDGGEESRIRLEGGSRVEGVEGRGVDFNNA
jgi:hypothetical protein